VKVKLISVYFQSKHRQTLLAVRVQRVVQCTWPPAVNGANEGPVDRRGPRALLSPQSGTRVYAAGDGMCFVVAVPSTCHVGYYSPRPSPSLAAKSFIDRIE